MTQTVISDKFLEGGKLARERLSDKQHKDNSFVVISNNGKVVRVAAKILKT